MRIAFDYQIFGFQEYGGVSRYVYELSLQFAKTLGKNVAVIAPLYVNSYLKDAPLSLNVMGISVPLLPKTTRIYNEVNSILSWSALRRFRPDIVHETYYSATRLAPAKAKVVLTVYDMIHERLANRFPIADPTTKLKAKSVERADHVICISHQTRQDLIDLFDVDAAKISVVHLGFTSTSLPDSEYKRNPDVRPFLLYVGNRVGYKNFELLLQAYAASPLLKGNFELVCFGGGGFTPKEISMLRAVNLSDRSVRRLSGDDAALARLYSSASAFVYPSLYEGFGIPPLEAMNFGCPVICSNVSSIPEVVGSAAEMFDPSDQDSIRTAIERVVTNQALQKTLIASGRERLKLFSWERCAAETMNVYSQVLA